MYTGYHQLVLQVFCKRISLPLFFLNKNNDIIPDEGKVGNLQKAHVRSGHSKTKVKVKVKKKKSKC